MGLEVLLISGGVESTTLLAQAVARGHSVLPLFVDYGQRAAARERAVVREQCRHHGLEPVELDMAAVGRAFRDRQVQKPHVPTPHRNLILLSLAVALAEQEGAETVSLALIRDDGGWYPSATPEFLTAFEATAATLGAVTIRTPLRALSKTDVIILAHELGVDLEDTYSCLLGYARHCGACPQCRKRQAAFAAAGLAEPPGFYRLEEINGR